MNQKTLALLALGAGVVALLGADSAPNTEFVPTPKTLPANALKFGDKITIFPPPAPPSKKNPKGRPARVGTDFADFIAECIEYGNANPCKYLKKTGQKIPASFASKQNLQALNNVCYFESNGVVGIPNFTYLPLAAKIQNWPQIYQSIREGRHIGKKTKFGYSDATGVFQCLSSNVKEFYPSALDGIGWGLEEGAGGLAYILQRYETPTRAFEKYQIGLGYAQNDVSPWVLMQFMENKHATN